MSQETIRTIVTIIGILGAGIGVYTSITSELTKVTAAVETLTNDVVELDKYDILLQTSIDGNKERIIRLEAQMEGNAKNYDRLIQTMDNLSDKLEVLGNKITDVKGGK